MARLSSRPRRAVRRGFPASLTFDSDCTEGGFNVREGRYVSTVWTAYNDGWDWVAFLWRDARGRYRLTHRMRFDPVDGGPVERRWHETLFGEEMTETDAIARGDIYRFIAKPWLRNELIATIRDAAERHRLIVENSELKAEVDRLESELSAAGLATASRLD